MAQSSYKPLIEPTATGPKSDLGKWLNGTSEGDVTDVLLIFPATDPYNICAIWKSAKVEKFGSLRLETHALTLGQKSITVELSGRGKSRTLLTMPGPQGIYSVTFDPPKPTVVSGRKAYVSEPAKVCVTKIGKRTNCNGPAKSLIPPLYLVGMDKITDQNKALFCRIAALRDN